MKKKSYCALMAAAMLTIFGGWQADAANSTSSVMDEVIVWGNKNHGVSIGEMPQDLAGGYISDGANLGYLGVTNT